MKKKFSFLFTAFLICTFFPKSVVFAQEVVCESEIELLNNSRDRVSIDEVTWNKNNSLTLFAFTQIGNEGEVTGSGSHEPVLVVYELSDSLQVQKKTEERVRPFYREGNGVNEVFSLEARVGSFQPGNKNTGKEHASAFPGFYRLERKGEEVFSVVDYLMGSPLVKHTKIQYEYDWVSNSLLPVRQEEHKFMLDVTEPSKGDIFIHDQILTNAQLRQISVVVGNRLEGDSQQFHHYLQQSLYVCNLEGEQLAKHLLSFDYPMELRHHQFVQDEEGRAQGLAFMFGMARRYGHKRTDSDPTFYRILLLDREGKLVFDHSFRYGENGCASEPVFAAVHREKLYLLGKGVGKEQDYHLMVFNEQGLLSLAKVDPDMLYANTVGEFKYSINKEYNSRFSPQGFQFLANGEVVFYGEHQLTVRNARFNPETNSQLPPEFQYGSYSFLHFGKNGDFLKNYVVPKGAVSDLQRPGKIHMLKAEDNRLQFLLFEPQTGESVAPPYQVFDTGMEGKKVCKTIGGGPEAPVVLSLELNRGKLSCLRFSEGEISLRGEKKFIMNPATNELLLLTTNRNPGLPVKLHLKKIRF